MVKYTSFITYGTWIKCHVITIGTHDDHSNTENRYWFDSLSTILPHHFPRITFDSFLRTDVGNPRNLIALRDKLRKLGKSMIFQRPTSLEDIRLRLPQWTGTET